MKKMYETGLAKEREEVMMATEGKGVEIDFDSANWEEEVGVLLDWSQSLDYEGYMDDWQAIGTSAETALHEDQPEEQYHHHPQDDDADQQQQQYGQIEMSAYK